MRDKVISLASGQNFAIIEEISYNNKKYALGAGYDLEKNDFLDNELVVMEIKLINGDIHISEIEDESVAEEVAKLLAEKIQNSEE